MLVVLVITKYTEQYICYVILFELAVINYFSWSIRILINILPINKYLIFPHGDYLKINVIFILPRKFVTVSYFLQTQTYVGIYFKVLSKITCVLLKQI